MQSKQLVNHGALHRIAPTDELLAAPSITHISQAQTVPLATVGTELVLTARTVTAIKRFDRRARARRGRSPIMVDAGNDVYRTYPRENAVFR